MPSNEVAPAAPTTAVSAAGIPDSPRPALVALARDDLLRLATGVRIVPDSGPTAGASSPLAVPRARRVVWVPWMTRVVMPADEPAAAVAVAGTATAIAPAASATDAAPALMRDIDMNSPVLDAIPASDAAVRVPGVGNVVEPAAGQVGGHQEIPTNRPGAPVQRLPVRPRYTALHVGEIGSGGPGAGGPNGSVLHTPPGKP